MNTLEKGSHDRLAAPFAAVSLFLPPAPAAAPFIDPEVNPYGVYAAGRPAAVLGRDLARAA